MYMKHYLNNCYDLLNSSPIARSDFGDLFSTEFRDNLARINSELRLLQEKVETPLKLVLMGEIKAGKSTIVNAIAGGKVSPVDVLESTACIIIVCYNDIGEAEIVFNDGSVKLTEPDEAFAILAENRGNTEFFSNCAFVRLGLPLQGLKHIQIVDTPGLATINSANAEVTHDFIQQSDVILWVLNAKHLGQTDISKEIEEVACYGKTIIGVVNRIDEVDSDPERLVEYVDYQLGHIMSDIFPLSAARAFDAVVKNDDSEIEASGFKALMARLEYIDLKQKEVQAESILNSAWALMRQALALHRSCYRQVEFVKNQVEEMDDELKYTICKVLDMCDSKLSTWLYQDYFEREYDELKTEIDEVNFWKLFDKPTKSFKDKLDQYFSEAYFKEKIKPLLKEITEEIDRIWGGAVQSLKQKVDKNLERFLYKEKMNFELDISPVFSVNDIVIEGLKEGAVAGLAFGSALAAWSAWLGPMAATVSLGTALTATVPPLVLAGAIAGLGYKALKLNGEKKESKRNLKEYIRSRKNDIKSEIFPRILGVIQEYLEMSAAEVKNRFLGSFDESLTEEKLIQLMHEINEYCAALEKFNDSPNPEIKSIVPVN